MTEEENRSSDLSDVVLKETDSDVQEAPKSRRRPKRVLHFSDGDLEEYSSEDEADTPDTNNVVAQIDPKTLNWLPWTWHQTTWVGGKVLDGCDCVGEWLANFFGITAPKYQFEINEFHRIQAHETEMMHKRDLEMGGWTDRNKNNLINDNTMSASTHS